MEAGTCWNVEGESGRSGDLPTFSSLKLEREMEGEAERIGWKRVRKRERKRKKPVLGDLVLQLGLNRNNTKEFISRNIQ